MKAPGNPRAFIVLPNSTFAGSFIITQRRKEAEFQSFVKLRNSVVASSLREQPASHRLEHAEDKRSSCTKGLRFNTQGQAKT